MNVARKGGKAEAKLSLVSAAGKGGESGELDWWPGLRASQPCSVGFSDFKRRKREPSLPTWQGTQASCKRSPQ